MTSTSERIAAELRRRIDAGEIRSGDHVPSTRQIAREWGVAIATATRALATLQRAGLTRAVRGVGTVVAVTDGPRNRTMKPTPPRRSLQSDDAVTREKIVRAAIDLADSEGVAALSMRRIASRLGLATMSLYRYFPSKDELVLAMMDATIAEARLPDPPPPGWRAQLELIARIQWAGYQRHPWLAPQVSMARPQMLPSGMLQSEWALRAVDGLGLDPTAMLHIALCLVSFVRGTAASLEAEVEDEQDTGMDADEWIESQSPTMTEIFSSGSYPVLTRLTKEPVDLDLNTLFEFGLARLLDGFATVIGSKRRSSD